MPPCIGLIGGLAVGASLRYYKRLETECRRQGLELNLVLIHANLQTVERYLKSGQAEAYAVYIAGLVERLAAAGATAAAITSVASHYGFAEVEARSKLPLVSILRVIRDEIEARGMRRVALFGSGYAMRSELYGALRQTADVVRLTPEETTEVDAIYMHLAQSGLSSPEAERRLTEIAEAVMEREEPDAVVLAGTDFSVMFDEHRPSFPYLDAVDAHVRAIADRLSA